jgi:uncharacterized alkaline shock family protein YloU
MRDDVTTESTTPAGTIQISNDVLADIAGYAALECYGIVGMASPSLRDGVAQMLSQDKLRKGVRIASDGEGVTIDLYVVAEYGTNLAEVAHNMTERVRYVVNTHAEVRVEAVNVHVQGIKVRK